MPKVLQQRGVPAISEAEVAEGSGAFDLGRASLACAPALSRVCAASSCDPFVCDSRTLPPYVVDFFLFCGVPGALSVGALAYPSSPRSFLPADPHALRHAASERLPAFL